MTSPSVDVTALDLRASRDRLERELARVVRERDAYLEQLGEVQARCTSLVEEKRSACAARDRLHAKLVQLVAALEELLDTPHDYAKYQLVRDDAEFALESAREEGESPDKGLMLGDDDGRCVLYPTARDAFMRGWDTINGKRAPWASNPWVWVVEFRRVDADAARGAA